VNKRYSIGAGVASLVMTTVSIGVLTLICPLARAQSLPAAAPTARVATSAAASAGGDPSVARGRYVVRIAGCNDCHTPGYNEAGGRLPEANWLTGSRVGFRGPWGTSYPSNLRLTVGAMTEDQWVVFARAERLPPMPWFSIAAMSEPDVRAIYRFIRALGPSGERAPAPLPPGKESALPFIPFFAQTPSLAQRR